MVAGAEKLTIVNEMWYRAYTKGSAREGGRVYCVVVLSMSDECHVVTMLGRRRMSMMTQPQHSWNGSALTIRHHIDIVIYKKEIMVWAYTGNEDQTCMRMHGAPSVACRPSRLRTSESHTDRTQCQ